jgi:redox-sensitive bicupin YhaK (pirin superfamily)
MSSVLKTRKLGFPWETQDPFLFCVHHDDAYPKGNEFLGPAASLEGRDLGQDFEGIDGWRMYHGHSVPGFPQHPHRGFETVTIARRGYIDHSDSLGAAARFGQGDVQWLTAGEGIVHSEMFPLLERDEPNPVELFQIWLNLPREDKLVKPHFAMLWDREVPRVRAPGVEVTVIAGTLGEAKPPQPPPKSWAARVDTDVAIWTIKLEAGAKWTLPRASGADTRRTLYFFRGSQLRVDGQPYDVNLGLDLKADVEVALEAGTEVVEALLLQGKPIAQPVVQYGPFVMNTADEIQKAFMDYRRTQFGGWPWPKGDPNHGRDAGRFARHIDGRVESGDVKTADKLT